MRSGQLGVLRENIHRLQAQAKVEEIATRITAIGLRAERLTRCLQLVASSEEFPDGGDGGLAAIYNEPQRALMYLRLDTDFDELDHYLACLPLVEELPPVPYSGLIKKPETETTGRRPSRHWRQTQSSQPYKGGEWMDIYLEPTLAVPLTVHNRLKKEQQIQQALVNRLSHMWKAERKKQSTSSSSQDNNKPDVWYRRPELAG